MDLPLFFTLPLIGGFAFVTSLWSLRWRSARQDSQRLYYRAAVYGVLIAAGVAIAHAVLLEWPAYRRGFEWLYTSFLKPLFTTKDALPAHSSEGGQSFQRDRGQRSKLMADSWRVVRVPV